jgi:hypothetical protein
MFSWPKDDTLVCRWARNQASEGTTLAGPEALSWPSVMTGFRRKMVDREEVFDFATQMLAGRTHERIILVRAQSNHGKSTLLSELTEYAQHLVPHALIDLKGCPTSDDVIREVNSELKRVPGYVQGQTLGDVILRLEELGGRAPVVVLFDTYEQCSDELHRIIETAWLGAVRRSAALCFIVCGQEVPKDWQKHHWARWAKQFELGPLPRPSDWAAWAKERHPELSDSHIEALVVGLRGIPGQVATALDSLGAGLRSNRSF